MPIKKTATSLAFLTCLLCVSACKVKVTTPHGGSVSSSSGDFHCPQMSECVIELEPNTALTETFTAIPNEGFKLYGWENGTYCKYDSGDCKVAIPASLTLFDFTLELIPEFGRPLRNDITINPLPRSVLLNSQMFEVAEIHQQAANENSQVWYAGSGDLDSDGNPEILLSGWTFRGFDAQPPAPPADLVVFEADMDKTRYLSAQQLLGRSTTSGTAFIRVEDFDLNGHQDILIAGHNESPFQFTPNHLLLNDNGKFTEHRVEPDMAMHEGSIGDFNRDGYPDFVGSGYWADIPRNPDDPRDQNGAPRALMLFINDTQGGFEAYPIRYTIALEGLTPTDFFNMGGDLIGSGSAAVMGDIDGDQITEIVIVDSPNILENSPSPSGTENWIIDNIQFEQGRAYGEKIPLPGSYFANKPHFDGNPYLPAGGADMSHEVQVELFDFDNDRDLDILIAAMVWGGEGESTYSSAGVLQFLENDGKGSFTDVTDQTLYNYNLGNAASHEMTLQDINHDGFTDIIMSERGYSTDTPKQWSTFSNEVAQPIPYAWSNEILINTGNGKFVSTFWKGFNDLSRRREDIFKEYGPEVEPYSLTEEPYFPYLLADGRLGFITIAGANPSTTFFFDFRSKIPLSTGPQGTNPAEKGVAGFSEYFYLTENPDVVEAISQGSFKNGLDHYLKIGKDEGRLGSAHEALQN